MKYLSSLRIVLLLLVIPVLSYSQSWTWSEFYENQTKNTEVRGVTVDKSNNIYTTVLFQQNVKVTPTTTVAGVGGVDMVLVKYTAGGNLRWYKLFAGTGRDYPKNVITDEFGNVYVVGIYWSDITIAGDTVLKAVTSGKYDSFVAKLDSTGNVIWARRVAWGPNDVKAEFFTLSPDHSIYVGGNYVDTVHFDGGTTFVSKIQTSHYILKLNSSGHEVWVKNMYGSNANSKISEINTYTNENIYIGGFFLDTLKYDGNTLVSRGNEDLFIIKLNSLGETQWIRQAGGTGADRCNGVTSDIYGNLYLTGYITGTALFDSTGLKLFDSSPLTSKGGYDMLIAKYNKNGILQWKRVNGSAGNDIGYSALSTLNTIQFTGYFSGQVIFNKDTVKSSGTNDPNPGFFVYNQYGEPINGQGLASPGVSFDDRGQTITYDSKGNTLIGGYFTSSTLTIGATTYNKPNTGYNNGFVAKFHDAFQVVFSETKPISCHGSADGSLTARTYYGKSPFTYHWSHNPTLNSPTAANLGPGDYSVTVTDANLATASKTIHITEPSALQISSAITNVSCYNYNNGAINLTVTGGTKVTDYSYDWASISGSGTDPNSKNQNNLTKGTYYVVVKDDNDCQISDTFTVTQPNKFNFGASIVTNVTNPPGSNGSINLTLTGGTSPYSYAWTGPGSYSSSAEDISGLNGGTYTIQINDNKACPADTAFVVFEQNVMIAQVTHKTDVLCYGANDGSATITVYQGAKPFSYHWSDGYNANGDSVSVRTAMGKGTYYLTVTDNISKTSQATVIINGPSSALSNLLNATPVKCYNENTGSIDLTVTGGTLPYSYHWNTSSTSEDLVNIPTGNYAVTVTDLNNCQSMGSISVTQPASPVTVDISVNQAFLCYGDLNGSLTANASGGTGTLSYLWDDPADQNTKTATELGPGNYTVVVTDINHCMANSSYQFIYPGAITINMVPTDVSCYGNMDGQIVPTVTGGTAPFDYVWSNGHLGRTVSGLSPGTYTVTVTDNNNCTNFESATISQPSPVSILSVSKTDPTCFGYTDGSISINANGGTGTLNYSVDNGVNFNTSASISTLGSGSYTIVVKDAHDCESPDSFAVLTDPAGIIIDSLLNTDVSCYGNTDGSITITAHGGTDGLTYSIDDGANFVDNGGIFTGLPAGNYPVKVKDIGGCIMAGSDLEVRQPDQFIIDTSEVSRITNGSNGFIHLTGAGGTPPYAFVIVPDSAVNNDGVFENLGVGSYRLFAFDGNNCPSNEIVANLEQVSNKIHIYDAFSPFTTPGKNDVWDIGNISLYPNCMVKVYNSWGILVFNSKGYIIPWDGTYHGNRLPSGTYYYIIDLGNGSAKLTGPVNIVN